MLSARNGLAAGGGDSRIAYKIAYDKSVDDMRWHRRLDALANRLRFHDNKTS
jgi:hypothetical protein